MPHGWCRQRLADYHQNQMSVKRPLHQCSLGGYGKFAEILSFVQDDSQRSVIVSRQGEES